MTQIVPKSLAEVARMREAGRIVAAALPRSRSEEHWQRRCLASTAHIADILAGRSSAGSALMADAGRLVRNTTISATMQTAVYIRILWSTECMSGIDTLCQSAMSSTARPYVKAQFYKRISMLAPYRSGIDILCQSLMPRPRVKAL